MVAANLALLSFAALSTLGFQPVHGARNGGRFRQRLPPREETTATIVLGTPTDGVVQQSSAEVTVASSAGTQDGTSQTVPPSTSLLRATAGTDTVTVGVISYINPGEYGAGGTLTTDSNAFTRTGSATRSSMTPNSSSRIAPPPLDTLGPGGRPPGIPGLSTSSSTPTNPTGTSSIPLNPNAPPIIPPMGKTTGTTKSSTWTLDLGHASSTTIDVIAPTPPPGQGGAEGPQGSYTTTMDFQNSTWTITGSPSLTTNSHGSTVPICEASDVTKPPTTWSIVYLSTITWFGNPDDYTPPYPPISTPEDCVPPKSPLRLTYSYCVSTGTDSKYRSCQVTTTDVMYPTMTPAILTGHATMTIVTTAKNPAVIYTSLPTPSYGVSQPGTRQQVDHTSADNSGPVLASQHNVDTRVTSPVTVVVQPTAVVINGQTITDNPSSPSQVVVIQGQTFTIDPSEVIGAGTTILRPEVIGGFGVSTPTSTNVGGVGVTVSSSIAVIGGTTFTVGPTATTTVINGQSVSVGPGGVAVGGQTIPVAAYPSPTQVVIAGGELITAIGPSVVVVHGTTITYGPASPSIVTTVNGDAITIGPNGITAHGTTLGGPSAKGSDTQFEIVGGATVTQIGPSIVVIGGSSYTVGPAAGGTTRTTTFGGETITIGPGGVSVSTYTIAYPFGPTVTITPGATGAAGTASSTSTSKDAASGLRPSGSTWASFFSCIALGALGLIL